MIELNQSWAGPYHAPGYTVSKLAPQDVKADPNADLYAAIPWAREAGLELIQLTNAMKYGTWMFVTRSHWFCADPKCKHDWFKLPTGGPAGMYGYYPTRAAALKSPPPKPPGVEQPPAQPSVGERLGVVCYEADKIDGSGPWSSLSSNGRDSWTKKALAVRREVLAEGFVDDDVNAAYMLRHIDVSKEAIADILSAALASRVARASREMEGKR